MQKGWSLQVQESESESESERERERETLSFGAPHSATVFQPSKRCLGLLDATLHLGMAPKCCSCNSSNSKCLSCSCVKAVQGRSCLNCSTGRAGRCHNPHQTTRFQSQPVLNAAAPASTSKICPPPEFPSSCPPLRHFHKERETQALSVGNHQTTHRVGEIGLSRREPQSIYGCRFSGPPSPSGGLNEPGKGSKTGENRHFSRLRGKDDKEEKDDGRHQGLDVCQGSDEERAYLRRSNFDPHGGRPDQDPLDRQMTSRSRTTSQTSHEVEGAVHACSALGSCDAESPVVRRPKPQIVTSRCHQR